ncbi:hypothetical protein GCM10025777_10560 [Membranihabitans marinus]
MTWRCLLDETADILNVKALNIKGFKSLFIKKLTIINGSTTVIAISWFKKCCNEGRLRKSRYPLFPMSFISFILHYFSPRLVVRGNFQAFQENGQDVLAGGTIININ